MAHQQDSGPIERNRAPSVLAIAVAWTLGIAVQRVACADRQRRANQQHSQIFDISFRLSTNDGWGAHRCLLNVWLRASV